MNIRFFTVFLTFLLILFTATTAHMSDFLLQKAKVQEDVRQKSNAYRSPILATSGVIELYDEKENMLGFVLVDRCNPPLGKALPGGLVEYGESLEQAFRREMHEEINLDVYSVEPFRNYSDPKRDPRFHVVDAVHIAKAKGTPKSGTDAKKTYVFKIEDIPWEDFAFDHAKILRDYILQRYPDVLKSSIEQNPSTLEQNETLKKAEAPVLQGEPMKSEENLSVHPK